MMQIQVPTKIDNRILLVSGVVKIEVQGWKETISSFSIHGTKHEVTMKLAQLIPLIASKSLDDAVSKLNGNAPKTQNIFEAMIDGVVKTSIDYDEIKELEDGNAAESKATTFTMR